MGPKIVTVRSWELRRLPLALTGLALTLVVAGVSLSLGREPIYDTILYALMALTTSVSGALIASHHPANPIGWSFCGQAVIDALDELAEGYGKHAAFAGAETAQWLSSMAWIVSASVWVVAMVLFPTGRLASRRWLAVVWVAIAAATLSVLGTAFGHAADSTFATGENPYAIDGVGAEVAYVVGQTLLLVGFVGAVAAVVVRFRRSSGVERQQLKWIVYAMAVFAVVGPLAIVTYFDSVLVQVAMAVVLLSIPVTVCVAILRYRLYDIDVVINRTLVYGVLTLLLAAAYALTTLLLSTAVGSDSAWVTAGATLAAATAFRPLRARVQDRVDRRFSKAAYEGRRRVGAFLEDLRAGRAAPEGVEDVLRDVLADPALQVRYYLPESHRYVDTSGAAADDPVPDGRSVTLVQRAGAPLGALVHDGSDDGARSDLVARIADEAGLAIEIARLRVELRRQLDEVETSRARIVAAGYEERQRIQRDLHDGAQQRFVSVVLALGHAQQLLDGHNDTAWIALDRAADEVRAGIAGLRELARGVRPAELDRGLEPALLALAARAPIPVHVDASDLHLPPHLEAAAYFIASEAVTNATKHADASAITVNARRDDTTLLLHISDDGIGGAKPGHGSGLIGLQDRVAAHNGTLTVESVTGAGTTLIAEIPCAS